MNRGSATRGMRLPDSDSRVSCGAQLPVPDPHDLLVARVGRDDGGPARDQRPAVLGDLAAACSSSDATAAPAASEQRRRERTTVVPDQRQLSLHGGEPLHPPHRRGLLCCLSRGSRARSRRSPPGSPPWPAGRSTRRRSTSCPPPGQHALGERQAVLAQQPGEVLVQGGDPVVVERRRAGAEDRHVLRGCAPNASRLRIICRATSRSASAPPRRSNLLTATTSAKSSMSIFSSCEAAPNSGVITYSDTSARLGHRRVALADARRLHDHQVVAGGLARGDDVRRCPRAARAPPRVASDRKNTRSPSRAFIRIRSPSSAPPPRRRVGSTASTATRSLSCWSMRSRRTSSSVSDDLPDPPVPVIPSTGTRRAAAACGQRRPDRRPAAGRPAGR